MAGGGSAGPREVLARLRGARAALAERPAAELARVLGAVGGRLLRDGDPLRAEALARIPGDAGISREMAVRILDGMAREWTEDRLSALLETEFGDPGVLDRFVPAPPAGGPVPRARHLRALGDGVALHVGAGSVPGVSATSVVRSLLVKTPVLVKPGAGDRALTDVFLRGLEEEDPVVAGAVESVYWRGGSGGGWEDEAPGLVDRLVVYGSDRTARILRDRAPVHVPVVIYHHRSGVAVVGSGALAGNALADTARGLAQAASTFDQRGCVSPHRVWVLGSSGEARRMAEALSEAMAREAQEVPQGSPDPGEMARAQQARATAEMRRAAGACVDAWWDPGAGWTVVLDEPGRTEPVGAPRSLVVTWAGSPGEVERALEPDSAHLQSVGLAGLEEPDEADLAERLARLGATRLVPVSDMSFPPAWWMHDGKGPLRALVRWSEWYR